MPPPELPSGFEQAILEEAVQSPSVAMMRLSMEVDRQLRLILAVTGQLKDYSGQSPTEALDLIAKTMDEASTFPQALRGTIEGFWNLRNQVVHQRVSQHLAIRAIDYGFRILRMLHSIPRRNYIVTENKVLLLSDPEGKALRNEVHGVLLQTLGPLGGIEGFKVHPTRKTFFNGQSVSWEWDLRGPGWEETWYLDPLSREIKFAWSGSLEFIGRPLDEI